MKLLHFIIFILVIQFVNAQDLKHLGKSFKMTQNYFAKKCDATGGKSKNAEAPLMRTFIVIVEAATNSGYVVSVPNFKDEALNAVYVKKPGKAEVKDDKGNIKTAAVNEEELYFFIPFTEFEKVCEEAKSRHTLTVGIPTIPVKLRFGNGATGNNPRYFRFEGNVSLGLSAGYKYSFGSERQYAINVLGGFTVASVGVDSLTTKGKVNSSTSAASFSPHIAFVFDVEKFQVGLYSGIDFLYGEPNKFWVYRNQPWLGIGIGFSLFNVGKPKETN